MDELSKSIESMIDTHGILGVIDALSNVCQLKAQHLEETWQDSEAVKEWIATANALRKTPYKHATQIAEHYGQNRELRTH